MPGPATANDYTNLGLRASATLEEVEVAYQQLAIRNHPDRSADPRAAERMRQIADSYQRIRAAASTRIYRVGEHQPEDDNDGVVHEVIPFDQAHWDPVEPMRLRAWMRVGKLIILAQAALAVGAVALAVGFACIAAFGDQSRANSYADAPLCSVQQADGCIDGPISATVDATLDHSDIPLVGTFSDQLRLRFGNSDTDVGVDRVDAAPFGGVATNDTVDVIVWQGAVVRVDTPIAHLDTDSTPTVIQARHRAAAWLWLAVAALLGARPLLLFVRSRASRPAAAA